MKIIRNFISLAFVIAAFSVVGINAQNNKSTRPVEQQIFKRILNLPNYGVFDNISFEYSGGTVTLSGKVLSLGTKKQAEYAVRGLDGVTNVVNNIEDLPAGSFDNSIRRELIRTFVNQPVISGLVSGPRPSVRIIVENGRVTLEGYVYNKGISDSMNVLANGVSGVFEVTNNLQIGDDKYR